jgi:hypothetical protein
VSNAVLFDLIANVSSIPGSPSNNDYIEIGNSTGIQSFTPLSGLPSGFVGAAGLTVRLRYDSSATSWVFMNYFANDSETRYVAIGNPNPTYYANQAAFPSATTYHGGVAHSHADGAMYYAHGGNWIKMAKDSDVTTNATNVATKLPLAGGTLTGDLTLSGAPTSNLHAATKAYVDTEVAGLVDAAPGTLDTLNELAAALGDDANFSTTVTNSIAAKMPLAGGTFTGNVNVGNVSPTANSNEGGSTLYGSSGGIRIFRSNSGGSSAAIDCQHNGTTVWSLKTDGSAEFTGNVDLQDNDKLLLGTGDDLEIYHDGSDNYIKAGGNLEIWSTNVNLRNTDGSEYFLRAFNNGEVQLFHDNSEKLRTDLHGVKITGVCTATDFDSTSDARLKTNVQVVDGALSKVNELRGVSFNWIETGQPSYGVIAQELETVLPELVHGGDPKKVNYNGIIGVLIESIKELSARVDELENK